MLRLFGMLSLALILIFSFNKASLITAIGRVNGKMHPALIIFGRRPMAVALCWLASNLENQRKSDKIKPFCNIVARA
jgi:hypothetical protein